MKYLGTKELLHEVILGGKLLKKEQIKNRVLNEPIFLDSQSIPATNLNEMERHARKT